MKLEEIKNKSLKIKYIPGRISTYEDDREPMSARSSTTTPVDDGVKPRTTTPDDQLGATDITLSPMIHDVCSPAEDKTRHSEGGTKNHCTELREEQRYELRSRRFGPGATSSGSGPPDLTSQESSRESTKHTVIDSGDALPIAHESKPEAAQETTEATKESSLQSCWSESDSEATVWDQSLDIESDNGTCAPWGEHHNSVRATQLKNPSAGNAKA